MGIKRVLIRDKPQRIKVPLNKEQFDYYTSLIDIKSLSFVANELGITEPLLYEIMVSGRNRFSKRPRHPYGKDLTLEQFQDVYSLIQSTSLHETAYRIGMQPSTLSSKITRACNTFPNVARKIIGLD